MWGGIECTVNRVGNRYFDQIEWSGRDPLRVALGAGTLRIQKDTFTSPNRDDKRSCMSRSQRGGVHGRGSEPPAAVRSRSDAFDLPFDGIFETAFNHIPAALALSDIESSRILDANQFFVELVGYSRKELIGHSSHDLNIWPDWDERNRIAKQLVEKGYLRNVEVLMRARSGQILNILASFDLIYLRGRPCVLGMAVDITDRKRHEVEMQQALKQADAANKAKSDFLANVSHEMRTPLTAIKGFAEILHQMLPPGSSEIQYLERLRLNVAMLSRLIDDTLDLAKVEAGKLEPQLGRVNLKATLDALISSLEFEFRAKGLELSLIWDASAPETIISDAKLLHQIVGNLLSNALRFTQQGMVTLLVRRTEDGALTLLVSDTGCGIAGEDASRIFDAFTQADSSYTRRYGGSGLGLTLARRMARALGGDVELHRSEIGVGSQFLVTLPDVAVRGDQPIAISGLVPPAPPAIAGDALRGMRVLVVEDGTDNRQVIAHFLKSGGADVSFAVNGKEAVERGLEGKFDLILMDIQMPLLDGYEAARRLKAKGCLSPIIMLTAAALEEERARCLAIGCEGYLTKPFEASTLVEQARAAIAVYRERGRASR